MKQKKGRQKQKEEGWETEIFQGESQEQNIKKRKTNDWLLL